MYLLQIEKNQTHNPLIFLWLTTTVSSTRLLSDPLGFLLKKILPILIKTIKNSLCLKTILSVLITQHFYTQYVYKYTESLVPIAGFELVSMLFASVCVLLDTLRLG